MKFKKLGAICKSHATFSIWNDVSDDGELRSQWMGTSAAAYSLDGLPTMTQDVICAIFDITEKQQGNLTFCENNIPATIDVSDSTLGEYPLEPEDLTINWQGRELIPMYTRNGIIFIDAEYLAPLDDVGDMLTLYARHTADGRTYVAAKAGLILVAILTPYIIDNKKFVDDITEMADECAKALEGREKP